MNWLTQVIVAVVGGFVLSAGATIFNQWMIAARVKQRLEDADELADERHSDNVKRLERIESKQDETNGTVNKHAATLEFHAKEIDRLRDGRD